MVGQRPIAAWVCSNGAGHLSSRSTPSDQVTPPEPLANPGCRHYRQLVTQLQQGSASVTGAAVRTAPSAHHVSATTRGSAACFVQAGGSTAPTCAVIRA